MGIETKHRLSPQSWREAGETVRRTVLLLRGNSRPGHAAQAAAGEEIPVRVTTKSTFSANRENVDFSM
jgi:hypothetical protein